MPAPAVGAVDEITIKTLMAAINSTLKACQSVGKGLVTATDRFPRKLNCVECADLLSRQLPFPIAQAHLADPTLGPPEIPVQGFI